MNAPPLSWAPPPISPIITIASVSGSSWKACRQSMWVVPITGSPPMPTAVEKPMSRSSYIIWYVSVPDLLTSPIRPPPEMSAGMMPALDWPGDATPGQFGPTMRVRLPCATLYAHADVLSCTGMPSVITTASGICASIASIIAALAKAGGTKITDTSAPVSFIASATPANTGTCVPSKSIVCPALRGLVPPTMVVPARSIRRVCLEPSDPVTPATMTRESLVSQIAMSHPCACELGGALGGAVHRVDPLYERVAGGVEDPPTFLGVVAVQAYHQGFVQHLAPVGEQLERVQDAVGHRVAGGDPAEDVDEHALDRRVGQDDLQPVGHHLGAGPA